MTWQSCRSITPCAFALLVAWTVSAVAGENPAPTAGATVGMGRIVKTVQVVTEKIFYVTDRRRTGSKLLSEQFAGERGDAPSFGVARVTVPALAADDPATNAETQAVKTLTWTEFAGKLSKAARVLVVVHGFNNTFDQALAMAARLRRNLRTEAAILLVSWPSHGSKLGYFHDEEEAQLSSRMMASVLTDVLQAVNVAKLQIVAHSLGTRMTVMALRRMFDSPERDLLRRLSQLVLVAPDIDRVWMDIEFVPVLEKYRIPTTVYGSEKDVWIGLSEFFHLRSRVGSFWNPSAYLRALLTSVDLSAVGNGGHSVGFSASVMYDIYFILEQELPPERRPWLWKIELATGIYWHFLPQLTR